MMIMKNLLLSGQIKHYCSAFLTSLLVIALASCGGGGGGGSIGIDGGTTIGDNVFMLPNIAGTWEGTWTSDSSGAGQWCAELDQDILNFSGRFYVVSNPSGKTIHGEVKDSDGNRVSGATVYIPHIPDSGVPPFPDMGYPLAGSFSENSIQFTSPGAGDIEFDGRLDTNTKSADGSFIRQSPVDHGGWDGARTSSSTECLPCTPPVEPHVAYACTDENGGFVLDASSVPGDAAEIKAFKGSRRGEVFEFIDQYVTIILDDVKIAVVTGLFDRIEDLLAKLGMGELDSDNKLQLGTETFQLYDGVNDNCPPNTPCNNSLDGSYPNFDELFIDSDSSNGPDINDYDIVFINCGNYYENDVATDINKVTILRNYVANGGNLYVTDLSYDIVEQVFPEFIDYLGDDVTVNAAQMGAGGITLQATVNDPLLSQWLEYVDCDGTSCLNPDDGTVLIEGFFTNWSVIDRIEPDTPSPVKVWVDGPVSWLGGSGTKPLTIMFDYGAEEGAVLFTSYHTLESNSSGFRPQERILQYLVFYLL